MGTLRPEVRSPRTSGLEVGLGGPEPPLVSSLPSSGSGLSCLLWFSLRKANAKCH